jgi:fucose permease
MRASRQMVSMLAYRSSASLTSVRFHPPGFALGGDVVCERRQHYLSILMAAGIAGGSIGPPLVGWLVEDHGMEALARLAK